MLRLNATASSEKMLISEPLPYIYVYATSSLQVGDLLQRDNEVFVLISIGPSVEKDCVLLTFWSMTYKDIWRWDYAQIHGYLIRDGELVVGRTLTLDNAFDE